MVPTVFKRLGAATALATALLACPVTPWAGGAGHGGMVFRPGGGAPGWHGGGPAFNRPAGAQGPRFGMRGLPPVSGIIHERPGMRPYVSGYGHTNTASGFPGYARLALGGAGRVAGGSMGPRPAGYGHTATGLRTFGQARPGFAAGIRHVDSGLPVVYGAGRARFAAPGFARFDRGRAFRDRVRFAGVRGGFGYGIGGAGFGYGGYGGYGSYADGGSYGSISTSGAAAGTYGTAGTYGGQAIDTQASGYGGAYISETPLAATFAEPPLAPSPGAGYSPGDRYAYAASADVPYAARIVSVNRAARRDCDCGPRERAEPVVYRYGVGTAY